MAHVPVFRLEARNMTGLGSKTETKIAWSPRVLADPRYVVKLPFDTYYRTLSILGVEKGGKELKKGKIFTLGVAIPGVVLIDVWAIIINLRKCATSIVASTSCVVLSKTNVELERDAGFWTDTWWHVQGSVRILEVKVEAGTDAVEKIFYENQNEKSSDNVVEGKRWSITLGMTVEQHDKNIMPATWLVRSEIKVALPEELRNPIP